MENGAWLGALFGASAVIIAALIGWFSARGTARNATEASKRQAAVEEDKVVVSQAQVDLDTIREMAKQAVADRDDARAQRDKMRIEIQEERREMMQRFNHLERRVTDLEKEREQQQRKISALQRYIDVLLAFIRKLGHTPPVMQIEPEGE